MYKLLQNGIIYNKKTQAYIPNNSLNKEFQEYQDWLEEGNEPEPADTLPPPPDWVGFNIAFLSNANWWEIAVQLPEDLRTGISASAATANAGALQSAYSIAKGVLESQGTPLDPAVLVEWQVIADTYNIPITF